MNRRAVGPRRLLFLLSASLNVALAAMLWHQVTGRGRVHSAPQAVPAALATAAEPRAAAGSNAAALLLVTNRANWASIRADEDRQYIINLRAVGCPEPTIRDILLGAVNRRYACLGLTVPAQAAFWSCGAEREAAERSLEGRRQALEDERQAYLRQLLGVEMGGEPRHAEWNLAEQAILQFILGPVPEASGRRVLALLRREEAAADRVRAGTQGVMLPQDEAAMRAVQEATRADIQQALTPGQFDEFAARSAAIKLRDHELSECSVTALELRAIARIAVDVFGPLRGELLGRLTTGDAEADREPLFRARLIAFLGEARWAQLEREQDPDYRGARQFAEAQQLPSDTALRLYEIQKLLRQEQERLQADTSLSDQERAVQAAAAQEASGAAVVRLLGRDALATYLNQGHGQWLTNGVQP